MSLTKLKDITDKYESTDQLPVIFIGHGNPMNAITDNTFTRHLSSLGKSFEEKPKAILVVSAHWVTDNTHVMISPKPKTIHDFGGFPDELYKIQYPAPGAPDFAIETGKIIKSTRIIDDENWGLDHGSWSFLKYMFPEANVPVFQLSIDYNKSPLHHFNLAKELKVLRKKGVLIIGSGNIVHNLYKVNFDMKARPYDWAIEFDELIKTKLEKREFDDLINYQLMGQVAKLSVPTNDHYLPMLYSLGLVDKQEEIRFTFEEIQNASISMRCFRIG